MTGYFDFVLVFVIAFVAGLLATAIVEHIARRLGIVSRPNPIVPQHTREVAYLGGAGVFAGWALAVACCLILQKQEHMTQADVTVPIASAIGALLFLVLGILDDLRPFTALPKFALQVLVAALVVAIGLVYPVSGIWAIDALLSMLWIVAVVNAMNFVDVCDGLAGGLALIMLLALAALGGSNAPLLVAAAGAVGGFLVLNAPPARIFLGDAGSHLLGFLLAAATLSFPAGSPSPHNAWQWCPAVLLLLGVPLFETVFITAMRRRKGLPWWKGSPDHFALRLQAVGFSRWQTDLLAWTCAAALGLTAHLFIRTSWPAQACLLSGAFLLMLLAWRWLRDMEVATTSSEGVSSKCKVCGEASTFIGVTDSFTDGARVDFLRHYRCSHCGLVFLGNRVSRDVLQQGYLELDARSYYAEVEGATRRKFETSIRDLNKVLPPESAILDIGAGNGLMISMLRDHGFAIADGHEIPGADVFAEAAGDSRIYRDFDYQSIPSHSYDAITLLDVAEHVPDPRHLFQACRRILKPSGVLYIHTPVVTRLDRLMHVAQRVRGLRRMGRMWQRVRTSLSHLQNFTPNALTIALREAGFEIVSLRVANELSWPVERYVRVHLCERLGLPGILAKLLLPIAYPLVATNLFNANKAIVHARCLGAEVARPAMVARIDRRVTVFSRCWDCAYLIWAGLCSWRDLVESIRLIRRYRNEPWHQEMR